MDVNGYVTNHLESDANLSPRKQLLVDLKRQGSNIPSQSSPKNSSSSPLKDYEIRLQNLLKSYKNGSQMSPDEIAKAAEKEAIFATKAAKVARANAEEKALIAAKAIKVAKDAMSQMTDTPYLEEQCMKNHSEKHVPDDHLYMEQQGEESYETDDDLAQNIHQETNNSPIVSKHSLNSKNVEVGNNGFPNDSVDDGMLEDMNSEEVFVAKEVCGEGGSSQTKERNLKPLGRIHSNRRKRGRKKQKTLPLSLCTIRDQEKQKNDVN